MFQMPLLPGPLKPRLLVSISVPSKSQIDLFKEYSYLIRPVQKKPCEKHLSKYECDSLTSKHKINQNQSTYILKNLKKSIGYPEYDTKLHLVVVRTPDLDLWDV